MKRSEEKIVDVISLFLLSLSLCVSVLWLRHIKLVQRIVRKVFLCSLTAMWVSECICVCVCLLFFSSFFYLHRLWQVPNWQVNNDKKEFRIGKAHTRTHSETHSYPTFICGFECHRRSISFICVWNVLFGRRVHLGLSSFSLLVVAVVFNIVVLVVVIVIII